MKTKTYIHYYITILHTVDFYSTVVVPVRAVVVS
jgi:hypothetical protein